VKEGGDYQVYHRRFKTGSDKLHHRQLGVQSSDDVISITGSPTFDLVVLKWRTSSV